MEQRDFDVQRNNPLTIEGQIEGASRFSRGMAHRYGGERVRRWARVGIVVFFALIVIAFVSGVV